MKRSFMRVMMFVLFFAIYWPLLARDVRLNGFRVWVPDDYLYVSTEEDKKWVGFENKSNTMRVFVVEARPKLFGVQREIDEHKDSFGAGNWTKPKLSTINGLNAYMSMAVLKRPEGIVGGTIIYFCGPDEIFGNTIILLLMASGTEMDIKDTAQIIQSVQLISQ